MAGKIVEDFKYYVENGKPHPRKVKAMKKQFYLSLYNKSTGQLYSCIKLDVYTSSVHVSTLGIAELNRIDCHEHQFTN